MLNLVELLMTKLELMPWDFFLCIPLSSPTIVAEKLLLIEIVGKTVTVTIAGLNMLPSTLAFRNGHHLLGHRVSESLIS